MTHPTQTERPLERLSLLFHKLLKHADFTTSDFAVTVYLATILQRLERHDTILQSLSNDLNSSQLMDQSCMTTDESSFASPNEALLSNQQAGKSPSGIA
jgi:hypothetical protein